MDLLSRLKDFLARRAAKGSDLIENGWRPTSTGEVYLEDLPPVTSRCVRHQILTGLTYRWWLHQLEQSNNSDDFDALLATWDAKHKDQEWLARMRTLRNTPKPDYRYNF